jgi:hypothetical protein
MDGNDQILRFEILSKNSNFNTCDFKWQNHCFPEKHCRNFVKKVLMDKIGMKTRIFNATKNAVEESAANLRAAMLEAQNAANEYGPPKDRYDSFRTQLLRKRDMYAQQLATTTEQINLLERINPGNLSEKVEFGVVVITETQKIFVSTGLGRIQVDGDTFFAISPAVPIYKAIEGKRAGDSFSFNNKTMKILDVF